MSSLVPARLAATAFCALATGLTAQAAPASAATIAARLACYVNTDPTAGAPMTISGVGFVPRSTVELSGGNVSAGGRVRRNGDVTIKTRAPVLSTSGPGSLSTTLTATDQNLKGPRLTATTVVRSANLAVLPTPSSVPRVKQDKVTWTFSGFTPGKRIYGFYMRRTIVAEAKFARASGPCGLLRQKALLYPSGLPAQDQYKVVFESSSRYSKNAMPRFSGTLNIVNF